MLATVTSGAVLGITGYRVTVEVQMGYGMVNFFMVGLPDGAVRESKQRVRGALIESGFDWPLRSVTVNLAPADIRKDGSAFDLPLALALLAADGRIPIADGDNPLPDTMVVGELGLSGNVRPIRGVLPLAVAARDAGLHTIIVPRANAREAAVVEGLAVHAVDHLRELVDHADGSKPLEVWQMPPSANRPQPRLVDLADVKGQRHVKRALEVAAAGGHNILMLGPPGSGKTMLARRVPGVLPPLSFEEALDVTTIYSVSGLLSAHGLVEERPFRAPHHTISDVGLVGGGSPSPKPGEVSLAHHGVLFLDELPEFRRSALEVLRQPLEDQKVTITRRLVTVDYPSQVMLVAAMNPCPCGYLGSTRRPCTCRPDMIERYRGRISGPLLDRIDIHVEVPDVAYHELRDPRGVGSTEEVRARVLAAREVQQQRLNGTGLRCNAQLGPREMRQWCGVNKEGHALLERVVDRLGMSARAHNRILKVARTIADLAGVDEIGTAHLAEAVAYRCLDRDQTALGVGARP